MCLFLHLSHIFSTPSLRVLGLNKRSNCRAHAEHTSPHSATEQALLYEVISFYYRERFKYPLLKIPVWRWVQKVLWMKITPYRDASVLKTRQNHCPSAGQVTFITCLPCQKVTGPHTNFTLKSLQFIKVTCPAGRAGCLICPPASFFTQYQAGGRALFSILHPMRPKAEWDVSSKNWRQIIICHN